MQSKLVEQTTRHQVMLERVKTGEANQFAAFLLEVDRSIRLRLSGVMTEFSRDRLERLLTVVESDLNAIYARHWDELSGRLIEIADYEAGFEARSMDKVLAGFEAVIPSHNQVRAAIFTAPLSVRGPSGGKLLEPFVKDWSAVEVKRVSGAIRQGFFEGQTTSKILQTVRGTKANKYRDGLLEISNRNASTVVRTAVQHAASVARQETWNQNSNVITGVQWVSTLDGRTSAQCQSLDGQVFPVDSGPRPPIHPNCRSTTVAVLDGRFDFLDEGATRASMGGYVPAEQTYYGWLKQQPAGFQDAAVGPVRGKLLRNGGLTAERFAELNIGKNFQPLTLPEMRRLEPLAFEKAGI